MTVSYSGKVPNARLAAFSRLLFYWRGSIYKLMYAEMIVFVMLYATCSLVYRFALNPWQRDIFEKIALHCETFTNLIPLSFVLGFYVSIVVTRWWNQFMAIPWPDRLGLYVATLVEGYDDHARLVRRTIMRYVMQSSLLTLQNTSVSVKKRFPTLEHLVESGVMTPNELQMLEEVNTPHGKWWVPFNWCFNLVKDARQTGLITDDYLLKAVMDELLTFRSNLGMLYNYDWISIPLVYTQVTTLAVYTFFIGCTLGRQFLDPTKNYPGHDVDLYVPVFTVLQFFFYMGWLKVAEQMINPFGEDDDDFDMNWIIDRNMQISMIFVDDMYGTYPKLEKDIYWDDQAPAFLPYTKSALSSITKPFMGSTADISISEDQMKVINPMETIQEEPGPGTSNAHIPAAESKLTSSLASPLGSPHHSRQQLANNLLLANHLRSHLSLSKSTLDGLKVPQATAGESCSGKLGASDNKPLVQTLTGSTTLPRPPSYIDGWLNQEPGSRFDISTVPAHLPSPLTHQRAIANAIARESQIITNPGHGYIDALDSASLFSMEKPESSVAPSVTPSLVGGSVAPSLVNSIAPSVCAAGPSVPTSVIVNMEDETPIPPLSTSTPTQSQIVVPAQQQTDATVDISSSSESLPEYELPDSNQCTVSSLTPLLKTITNTEDLV